MERNATWLRYQGCVLFSIPDPTTFPDFSDDLVAAHRHKVYGRVGRWLIHDLRNPTQALALVTELMDEEAAGDAGMVETVREATSHVTRSLALLDRLLRPVPASSDSRPLPVRDSLAFVVALFHTHRWAATLTVDLDSAGVLPAVRGVEHELEHVLLTLLLGALDRVGDCEAEIMLDARPDSDEVVITLRTELPASSPENEAWGGGPDVDIAQALLARQGGRLTLSAGRAQVCALHLPRWVD